MDYNIIETVADNSGNIVLSGDGRLAISGAPVVPLKNSKLSPVVAAGAAVAGVVTVTIASTLAANTTYGFVVTQRIGSNIMSRTILVTTGAIAPTASSVSNMFKRQIENYGLKMTVSVGGSSDTVSTITASGGYEVFTVVDLSNTTVAVGTVGVYAVGLGANLNAMGLTGFTEGNYYDAYSINIGGDAIVNGGFITERVNRSYVVYVNIGTNPASVEAKAAKFRNGYANVSKGFVVNDGVAVATQAATGTAITAAGDLAALKVAVAPLAQIGVNSYNQVTTS